MKTSFRFVERVKTPIGEKRWVYYAARLHYLGHAFWGAAWLSREANLGHIATYHFNGKLIARSATYTGV